MKTDLDIAQIDTMQLISLQSVHDRIVEIERLKAVHHHFFLHHFSVSSVEPHGDGYRVNLLFWPRRSITSDQPLKTQSALEKRVAKAGYVLLGYSDKPGDMHLIVAESAKGVQK